MYCQSFFTTSVRGSGLLPTISASTAEGCISFMNAAFGLRFAPADFFAGAFLAVVFLAAILLCSPPPQRGVRAGSATQPARTCSTSSGKVQVESEDAQRGEGPFFACLHPEVSPGRARMRALVTGANGFLGTWLTRRLVERGDE